MSRTTQRTLLPFASCILAVLSAGLAKADLPPGPGHDLTVKVCSGCHSADLAASQHLSPQDWNSLVQSMSARGADATDAELKQITDYLAKSFPASAPATK